MRKLKFTIILSAKHAQPRNKTILLGDLLVNQMISLSHRDSSPHADHMPNSCSINNVHSLRDLYLPIMDFARCYYAFSYYGPRHLRDTLKSQQ